LPLLLVEGQGRLHRFGWLVIEVFLLALEYHWAVTL
jgi:hypothetical protein